MIEHGIDIIKIALGIALYFLIDDYLKMLLAWVKKRYKRTRRKVKNWIKNRKAAKVAR